MDALQFAKTHLEEIRARIDNAGDTPVSNVITQFFKDQGHEFKEYDIEEIMDLVESEKEGGETLNG